MGREDLWQERAKPIGNFSGTMLVIRTFFDIKLASVFSSIKTHLKSMQGTVLEVGCGNQPYRFLIQKAEYHGIDHVLSKEFAISREGVKYYEDATFPEDSLAYDWCFHTEVLEHIADPDSFFRECHRVLKPSGKLLFSAPFSYRYHYIPYDYCRYTPSGLKILLEKNGFRMIEIRNQGTDITVACHKTISVFFRLLTERDAFLVRFGRVLFTLLCLPYLFMVHLIGMLSLAFPWGSPDDPLGYVVIAEKMDGTSVSDPNHVVSPPHA